MVKTAYGKAKDQLLRTARPTYTTKSELLAALLPEFKDALTAMHAEFMESLHNRIKTTTLRQFVDKFPSFRVFFQPVQMPDIFPLGQEVKCLIHIMLQSVVLLG